MEVHIPAKQAEMFRRSFTNHGDNLGEDNRRILGRLAGGGNVDSDVVKNAVEVINDSVGMPDTVRRQVMSAFAGTDGARWLNAVNNQVQAGTYKPAFSEGEEVSVDFMGKSFRGCIDKDAGDTVTVEVEGKKVSVDRGKISMRAAAPPVQDQRGVFGKIQLRGQPGFREMLIMGDIGPSEFGMIDDILIAETLSKVSKTEPLTLKINSPGGDYFTGVSAYQLLMQHQGEITTVVTGEAASAASLIQASGSKRIGFKTSSVMIHLPSGFFMGDEREVEKALGVMRDMKETVSTVYVDRWGMAQDEAIRLMEDETYFFGQKALDAGIFTELSTAESEGKTMSGRNFIMRAKRPWLNREHP